VSLPGEARGPVWVISLTWLCRASRKKKRVNIGWKGTYVERQGMFRQDECSHVQNT